MRGMSGANANGTMKIERGITRVLIRLEGMVCVTGMGGLG